MKTHKSDLRKPSFWQLVFLQSKVNRAGYDGEQLPRRNWDWPKDTYLKPFTISSATRKPR